MSKKPIIWWLFHQTPPPTLQPVGWMNYRTATRLDIREDNDSIYIQTRIPGIMPDGLDVYIADVHLFIEGYVGTHKRDVQYGRYVRNIPSFVITDPIRYHLAENDIIIVEIPKQTRINMGQG